MTIESGRGSELTLDPFGADHVSIGPRGIGHALPMVMGRGGMGFENQG